MKKEVARALLDEIFASLEEADRRIYATQQSIDALAAETRKLLDQLVRSVD
jgi:hypothetical protein